MRLAGQVALVTGGASGIGRAVTEAFLAAGCQVGVLDRSQQALAQLKRDHAEVVAVPGDVTSLADHDRSVAAVLASFGKLDVLVGNAGIGDRATPLVELPADRIDEAFDEVFRINVKGCLLAARAAHPELEKTKGSIIFTASYSSFFPAGGGALYVASKHAVLGLTRQLAYEFAPAVRVNAVAPGVAPTALGGVASLGHDQATALLPGIESFLPLGFLPTADDHAGAYVYLASNKESRALTGSVISTDSGLSVRGIMATVGGT